VDRHRGNLEAVERLRDIRMERRIWYLATGQGDRYMPATQAMALLTTVVRTSNNRSRWTVTVLLCALSIGLSGCSGPDGSQNIGPKFTIKWTSGAKPQDSHVQRALYYGERQIAFDILEYELSPDPEILLYYNNQKDSGLYVFDGHNGTNTRVHDVLPNGIITSKGIGFPTQYSVHWSSDAAYVVVGDDYHKRWQVIDIFQAHVLLPVGSPPTMRVARLGSQVGSRTAPTKWRTIIPTAVIPPVTKH
jgi:hypothetical protein